MSRELGFAKLSCSEFTYKIIAVEMQLSPRAVDALRDQLFNRLDVKAGWGWPCMPYGMGL